jgi:hypothetical protein
MKHARLIKSISAAALALLTLASLAACQNSPDEPVGSDTNMPTATPTEPAVTTTATDPAETDAPMDPDEPDAVLTPDGAVAVVSPYAASWEKSAAEALAAELGLTVVSDGSVPTDKALLVVGYTALNDRFGADFEGMGDMGYTVTAVDGSVLVAANTEAGLDLALAAFRAALTADKVLPAATNAPPRMCSGGPACGQPAARSCACWGATGRARAPCWAQPPGCGGCSTDNCASLAKS